MPEKALITYIVRRLVAAIALLFVVSVITFSIFYLVPRLAGASPESLATQGDLLARRSLLVKSPSPMVWPLAHGGYCP